MAKRRKPAKPAPPPVSPPRRFERTGRWLPYILLAIAVVSVFMLQNFKVGFEKGHHGYLSSHGAAIAKNLSFGDRLLLFHAATVSDDGKIAYQAYNRFPLFPFAVIKVAMVPFEPNLSLQVYAARQVMNVFLALAMFFAFLAVRELVEDPYLALSAVLFSFSSFYILYYADMIFNDVPALCGFTLAILAAVKSRTSGLKTRWVILAAIAAISMGWQPYAVLGAWFLVDLVQFLANREGAFTRAFRRPASLALCAGILWGIAVLGLQSANEASVMGRSIGDIDTINAIRFRIGAAGGGAYDQYAAVLQWSAYLRGQAERIVLVFSPAILASAAMADISRVHLSQFLILVLFAGGTAGIATRKTVRWKAAAIVLPISGFIWSIPMKHFVAFHDFQTIFYIGLPLAAFTGLLLFLPRKGMIVAALLAVAFFVFNLNAMNLHKERIAGMVNPVTSEFEKIYAKVPRHSKVYIDGDRNTMGIGFHAVDFYLAGSYFSPLGKAEYVVSANPFYNSSRLTFNGHVNLFAR